MTLQWRHNEHDSVSNHQPHGCLLNQLFRRRSKKTSKLRVTGLCVGNSPGPVNSPHKGSVTRKMFPFDDVIMTEIPTTMTCVETIFSSELNKNKNFSGLKRYIRYSISFVVHKNVWVNVSRRVFGINGVVLYTWYIVMNVIHGFCKILQLDHRSHTLTERTNEDAAGPTLTKRDEVCLLIGWSVAKQTKLIFKQQI